MYHHNNRRMSLLTVHEDNPLKDLFPDGKHSVIQIPRKFLYCMPNVGQAYIFPNISKFHVTTPLRQVQVHNVSLAMQCSSLYMSEKFEDKSGVFLLDTPEYAVLGFGRQLFSNFVEHRVETKTLEDSPPLILPCGESIFKLACCTAHRQDRIGFEDATRAILYANTPLDIKNATRKLRAFNRELWDAQSRNAMATTICLLATDPQFYATLKNVLLLLRGGPKRLHVIEFNPDDAIWGVAMSVTDALNRIILHYDIQSLHGSLHEFVRHNIIGSDGNQLGNLWTSLLDLLQEFPTYEMYKQAVDQLNILQIIIE